MSQVLVVQPDPSQEDNLRQIFRRIGAELVLVYSTREAVDAIALHVPDLILLSTFMSPRDEDALMSHLRTLDGAAHLQTLTLPQLRTKADEAPAKKGGFFSRKKAKPAVTVGIDPAVFAEEVVAHLHRATEIRNRPVMPKPFMLESSEPASFPAEGESQGGTAMPYGQSNPIDELFASEPARTVESGESYAAQPYEPVASQAYEPMAADPYAHTAPSTYDQVAAPAYDQTPAEPYEMSSGVVYEQAAPSYEAPPEPAASGSSFEDDIDRIARELGLDVRLGGGNAPSAPSQAAPPAAESDDPFDFGVSLDRARNAALGRRSSDITIGGADAEAIREAAIAEARAAAEREAREALAELSRVQAEAEAMREAAIAEARAAAEREAREALAADLARVQAEAEAMREAAIAEARSAAEREARERLETELARVRSETEQTVARVRSETEETVADALNKVKQEAEEAERARIEAERLRQEAQEAQEAFAADLARVRAEVEQSLAAQLETSRAEAERMRAAEAAAVRERAAIEAQLKSELERLRVVSAQARKADENETRKSAEQIKKLEAELARVHKAGEERQAAEVKELRAQMAEMREAAAKQARAAAAEAVASQVARAAAHADSAPRKLNVVRMPARLSQLQPIGAAPEPPGASPPSRLQPVDTTPSQEPRGDYYNLWQPTAGTDDPVEEPVEAGQSRFDYKRHAKWALPVAACLLLVTTAGTAISTSISSVTDFVAADDEPSLKVEPADKIEPLVETIAKPVGTLQVESTPVGAEVIVDGKSYGAAPVTVADLAPGSHTVTLKHTVGTVTKKVSVKAGETALVSEAIFAGWVAIFSPIAINVVVDGEPMTLPEDGRFMLAPGKHVVALISERFNYRSSETFQVRPGETTAHTVTLPMGTVRVTAPEGVEIRVDGQPVQGNPSEGVPVQIGSHEITGVHPQLGERRVTVDVRHASLTDVTLPY